MDMSPSIVEQARATAALTNVPNVTFTTGDIHALPFGDSTFDVVHAHQVLQHVHDPVHALQEMRRVAKPGGIVAARESDYSGFVWFPEVDGMQDWKQLYLKVARACGGEPDAGRRLLSWARASGFARAAVTATAGTWCYSTAEERKWWSEVWAERTLESSFSRNSIDGGHANEDELRRIAEAWTQWGKEQDGWFTVLHGEILCRV
jgi:ubiquinone/menaquinone biosynthesis C-methylase UbiE